MDKLKAIELLLECDPSSIIDDNWWDYFKTNPTYYNAMIVLSGFTSYQQILTQYEGYYIRDFILDML